MKTNFQIRKHGARFGLAAVWLLAIVIGSHKAYADTTPGVPAIHPYKTFGLSNGQIQYGYDTTFAARYTTQHPPPIVSPGQFKVTSTKFSSVSSVHDAFPEAAPFPMDPKHPVCVVRLEGKIVVAGPPGAPPFRAAKAFVLYDGFTGNLLGYGAIRN
jgi:hypothetical protein